MKNFTIFVLISLSLFLFFSCNQDIDELPESNTLGVIETLESEGLFVFSGILKNHPQLLDLVEDDFELTLFAPTDEAFEKAFTILRVNNLEAFTNRIGGVDFLVEYISTHFLKRRVISYTIMGQSYWDTASGISLGITPGTLNLKIRDAFGGEANTVKADIIVKKGYINIIDAVIWPNYALEKSKGRNGLIEVANSLGFSEFIGSMILAENFNLKLLREENLSIFIPTNSAFQRLFVKYGVKNLEELIEKIGIDKFVKIVQFHVVPEMVWFALDGDYNYMSFNGQTIHLNKTGNVILLTDFEGQKSIISHFFTDTKFNNGVFHPISEVMIPDMEGL